MQWFFLYQSGQLTELWHRLDSNGVLEERLIDSVWREQLEQKPALLGLMEKFDLIAERISPKTVFYIDYTFANLPS